MRIAPLLRGAPEIGATPLDVIGAALAVPSLIVILVGWFWAKSRVPRRPRNQSTDDFWRSTDAVGKALLLWILAEGGTLISLIGFVLTGSAIPTITAAFGLVVLLTNGPQRLEDRLE
jgi:hypothetical protein